MGNEERFRDMAPADFRRLVRAGRVGRVPTAGFCAGYAQANLVILPQAYAGDFLTFTRRNPAACPVLEVLCRTPLTRDMAADGNILTDIPAYRVYRNGALNGVLDDATALWQADMVGFLIGCSFSFEEALIRAGIEMRHIAMGRNVPMYKTNVPTRPAGPFQGPVVVSMRPMTPADARLACEITAAMPNVHGAPLHVVDPKQIGISDLDRPDYGDPVDVRPGEVPVFWPCGVTPQAAMEQARPSLAITHAPGHMFITDVLNSRLNDVLEANRSEERA